MAKKIVLTSRNNDILGMVKFYNKTGSTTTQIADSDGISFGSAVWHLDILKKAGMIVRDKKTKLWSVKK